MADISKRKDLIRACYAPDRQSADQMIAVLGQYGINAVRSGGVTSRSAVQICRKNSDQSPGGSSTVHSPAPDPGALLMR